MSAASPSPSSSFLFCCSTRDDETDRAAFQFPTWCVMSTWHLFGILPENSCVSVQKLSIRKLDYFQAIINWFAALAEGSAGVCCCNWTCYLLKVCMCVRYSLLRQSRWRIKSWGCSLYRPVFVALDASHRIAKWRLIQNKFETLLPCFYLLTNSLVSISSYWMNIRTNAQQFCLVSKAM